MAANKIDARQSRLTSAQAMIGSAASATIDTVFPKINDELAKLFEDRNILLADGGSINYTGTTVTFTEALKLHVNSKVAGGSPTVIDLGATTRTISASGRMIYAVLNRTGGTATITDDATTLPAVTSTDQEVFLIAKRVDAGDGTKRLYFRNGTTLNEGQTSRLGSGGGSLVISALAGENLTTNDIVYISKGNALGDTGRTTGRAYKVDATNDERIEFVGFVTQSALAAANVNIQIAGELTGFTGLSQGIPLWVDTSTPGAYTQTAPSTTGVWLIPVGSATDTTKIAINAAGGATATYLETTSDSFAPANNTASQNVTNMSFNGAVHRSMKATYALRRKTDTALSEVVQTGEIRAWYNTQTATYDINTVYYGEDCGTTFSITGGGQVQASTTNITGANYVGEMRWTIEKLEIGV